MSDEAFPVRETEHFSNKDLACPCCRTNGMRIHFLRELEILRIWWGRPLTLSSAFRCPAHNARVSKTGESGPHTKGLAVDVLVSGQDAFRFLKYAIASGFPGIGINQAGPMGSRYIHIDMCEDSAEFKRPRVWTY
jgi:uncharacterized protein YcbK (DUF882 family)